MPHHRTAFPPEDRAGFAIPASPSHSLRLLNDYMRTDLLRAIHQHIHRMMENPEQQQESPLRHLADSLKLVIESFDQNPHHINPSYVFNTEECYTHDIKLMRHHLKCHKKTIKEIEAWQ